MGRKILLAWLFGATVLLQTSWAETDILIVTEEWAPFNYMENGTLTGFSTEIVQRILELRHRPYKIELLPSIRSSHTLNTRPRTMMFSMFRTPERERRYKWIGPLCDGSIYFYKKRGAPVKTDTLEDLKKVPLIACRHKGLIPEQLKAMGFANLDTTAVSSLLIYKKLLAGRCDVAVSDTDLGVKYYLKSLGVDTGILIKIPVKIFQSKLYIAASQDISDREIFELQTALDQLKASGTYDRIFETYN